MEDAGWYNSLLVKNLRMEAYESVVVDKKRKKEVTEEQDSGRRRPGPVRR